MRTGALALLAAAGLLLGASLLFGGGSADTRLAVIGAAAILAAAAAVAASLWGILPAPRLGREGLVFAGLAAGFVAWNGVSILWSAAPDRSWNYFNRGLVYLAFAVVGAFVGSAVAPRIVAWLYGGLVAATCLWGLAGKAVAALYDDYGRFARLRSPVGYWNALALVAVFGLPLALWAATRSAHLRVVRAGAVVILYALLVALVLTYSRGGVLAAVVGIGIWLALSRERFEGVAALAGAGVPAAAVLAFSLSLPGIAQDGQSHDVRVHDGALFAAAFALGAVVVFAATFFIRLRPGPERQRLLLRIAAAAAGLTFAVAVVVVAARGNPLGGSEYVTQNPQHLLSTSSNNRWPWWKEAWQGFEGQPIGGTGAGSFELLHRKLRKSGVYVTEPHNLPLQFLAETGLAGFLLAAGAAGAALLGACRALRRLDGTDRMAAVALAITLPTFLVHGVLDFDWDFIAVCGPVFFITGFLLTSGRSPGAARRRPFWALGAVLVAWALLYSIAAPSLATQRVDNAYADIDRGAIDKAVASAKSAQALNPLSVDPLYAWAAAEEARGRPAKAQDLYLRALDLQPLNWDTWYELGRFDLDVLGDRTAARHAFQRAAELDTDPLGRARQALKNLGP
jgi:hypothetical protein